MEKYQPPENQGEYNREKIKRERKAEEELRALEIEREIKRRNIQSKCDQQLQILGGKFSATEVNEIKSQALKAIRRVNIDIENRKEVIMINLDLNLEALHKQYHPPAQKQRQPASGQKPSIHIPHTPKMIRELKAPDANKKIAIELGWDSPKK